MKYMKGLFHDWQAKGITSVLHEKKGGYANNTRLDVRPRRQGGERGRAHPDRRQGHRLQDRPSGAVSAVVTDQGIIDCDYVVVGVGPWVKHDLGACWTCRQAISIKGRDGKMHDNVPMWIYWCLQEGTLGVDPKLQTHQRRQDAAGDPRRHRRAALFRRRRLADHRQAVGHLLQARLQFRRRAGRRHALQDRTRSGRGHGRSLRPGIARVHRRRRVRAYVVLGAGLLPEALRREVCRNTRRSRRAASAASRRTASRCSTCSARTATSSPTPTTATR